MNVKVALVCGQEKITQSYLNAMKTFDIQVDAVSSFRELYRAMIDTPYHGVMVDSPTKIKATHEEKELVHKILEVFPTIFLRWESKAETIRTFYYGQFHDSLTLQDFIDKECRFFNARKIRSTVRKNTNFNVLLARDNNFNEENIERVVTINISKGGCFIYSNKKWDISRAVWFVVKELSDNTPIIGEVRQTIEWGKAMQIPGIGVMYKDIKKCQLEEICLKSST